MQRLLYKINGQERISYESQIALWLYDCYCSNKEISFEESIITEDLIEEFNKDISLEEFRKVFLDYLHFQVDVIKKLLLRFNEEPWNFVKPVIWNDRIRDRYYIENLTKSHRFEVYIDKILYDSGVNLELYYGREEQYNNGENALGIEIKRDMKSSEGSPNLYIEYRERLNINMDVWTNSGILREDNTRFYLIGDIDSYWIFRKADLVNIYNILARGTNYYNGCRFVNANRGTSKGFIMPKTYANKISISIEQLVNEINN